MNNLVFNEIELTNFRKDILTQYLYIENNEKFHLLPELVSNLSWINAKAYAAIYNFLLKAAILNAFKTSYYSPNQTAIADFLKNEMLQEFKFIKFFLIIIMDCGCCRFSHIARNAVISKNYVSVYSYAHIANKLKFIQINATFFKHTLNENSHEEFKACVDNFLCCYEMLEFASSLEEKIVAVSKVLNVWHCNGPFFHKNYSKEEDLNNPTAPFTKEQFDNLSNITSLQVEKEIKKLL